MKVLLDFSCWNMLIGIFMVNKMGLSKKNLILVAISMHTANKGEICMLRALLVSVGFNGVQAKLLKPNNVML